MLKYFNPIEYKKNYAYLADFKEQLEAQRNKFYCINKQKFDVMIETEKVYNRKDTW